MFDISVVIPTYQRPQMLQRLLNSVAHQTLQPVEVIVVDDGSDCFASNTSIIEKYQDTLPIRYIYNSPNRGACHARNHGISLANGNWIALVDDDDEWMPTKLEKQVERLESCSNEVGIIYTWADVIRENVVVHQYKANHEGKKIRRLLDECFIPSPTVLVKTASLQEAGLFDETLPSCQDWDMWTRIMLCGYTCAVVPSVQAVYHQHTAPTIGKTDKEGRGLRMFYEKHRTLYWKYHPIKSVKNGIKRRLSSWLSDSHGAVYDD